MSDTARQTVLLRLAAEAVLPALPGCAEVLGGGATTSRLVERGLGLFGPLIAAKWHAWSRAQPDGARGAALAALAALAQEEARREAADALARLAPDARVQDRVAAAAYLAAIPRTVDRLWQDDPTGAGSPATVSWEQPDDLLQALPEFAPPYAAPCDLPGTPYRLEQLLGAGGFGAVYRAAAASLQHLPLAVKFCLDPGLMEALQMERANLERLMQAGRDAGSQRIVRLYGYDFSYATPYLVYEYVPGGDLGRHVRGRRRLKGRPLDPSETLEIIRQVAEGLAFAHRHGLVHRDLKPANILVDGRLFKLADFGLGGAAAARVARSGDAAPLRMQRETTAGEVSRFRGAGTPLYMAPEQRLGAPPDPRHDLFSLGVMWHQLLAHDFRRELLAGWAKVLAVRFRAPRPHLELIESCVGRIEDRPKDAGELLAMLQALTQEAPARPAPPPPPEPPPIPPLPEVVHVRPTPLHAPPLAWVEPAAAGPRQVRLLDRLKGLRDCHEVLGTGRRLWTAAMRALPLALLLFVAAFVLTLGVAVAVEAGLGGRLGAQTAQHLPTLLGLAAGAVVAAAVVGWRVVVRKVEWDERRQDLEVQIEAMNSEFPDVVEAWGGPDVLRERAVVLGLLRQTRRDLEGPWRPPDAPRIGVPADRRKECADLLRRLSNAHAAVARQSTWPGNSQVVLLGLAAGGLVGWLCGELFYTMRHPDYGFLNAFNDVPFDEWAIVCGLAVGFAVWGLAVAAQQQMWYWRFRIAREAVRLAVRRLADRFPEAVQDWGGEAALNEPAEAARLLHAVGRSV